MKQTILITGATGYLGSHLVRSLVDAGHRVAILKRVNSSLQRLESYVPRLAMFNTEDGLDLPFKSLGHVDTVIHAATCFGRAGEKASEVFEANTAFPLQLLEMATFFNTNTFFNTDTIFYKYLNSYSLSKHHFAEWGKSFADGGKIAFVNVKLEHMYGVGDDPIKFVSYVIRACISDVVELKLTLGEQQLDFIHIEDVVNAYQLLVENASKLTRGFLELGIGSGQTTTVRDLLITIQLLAGSKTKFLFGAVPYREHEIMHSAADISKLAALGWRCRYDIETGLKQVIEQERSLP